MSLFGMKLIQGDSMDFKIIPLRHEDLCRIYADDEGLGFGDFGYRRQDWPTDMLGYNWAVDGAAGCFLLRMPPTREKVQNRYLFGVPGGVVLFQQNAYCKYTIVYVSEAISHQLEKTKELMREALRVSGEYIDGATDVNDASAVPCAEFS
jgi:hypothetical protein